MTDQHEDSGNPALTSSAVDLGLVGIGSWLMLPAIGFVIGPIFGLIGFVAAFAFFSDVARAGYGGVYALELFVQAAFLIFLVYAATRFFGKKRNAPLVIITMLLVSMAASVFLLIVEITAGAEEFASMTGKQLVRDVIGAAIWIPYFRVSKRVKNTFVN